MSLIDTFARIFSSRASSSIALGDSPSSSRPPSEIDVGRASLNQSAPSGRLREVKAPGQFEDSFNMSVPGGRLAERESPGTIKSSAPDTINKGSSVGPLIAYHTLGEPVWTMVHAMEGAAAAEITLTPWWRRRIAGTFRFPGLV